MSDETRANDQDMQIAEAHPLFQTLPEQARHQLAKSAERVTLAPGDTLIREDEFNHHLYLILAGTARVVMNGTETARIGKGDIAGEISASGLSAPIASVIADSALTALAFPIEQINDAALAHPDFADKMREIGMGRVSG